MDVKEWLEIITRTGWPVVALVAFVWFLYKAVWPFFLKQIDVAQAGRQAEVDRFLAALARRDDVNEKMARDFVAALDALRDEIRRQ